MRKQSTMYSKPFHGNGNIKIGDSSYELRAAKTRDTSENVLEIPDLIGKRYHLIDQRNIGLENIVGNEDLLRVKETRIQEEFNAPFGRITEQEKQNYFRLSDASLPPRKVGNLHDRGNIGENRHQEKKERGVNGTPRLQRLKHADLQSSFVKVMVIEATDHEVLFPHKKSKVITQQGITYVDANQYLEDLSDWDLTTGIKQIPQFDNAMLFTTLGADHDGEGDAVACKSEDFFIMTNMPQGFTQARPCIRNMWIFSNCSVESFKKKLASKQCVKTVGSVYSITEWEVFMQKEAGDVFTPHEQCFLIYGQGSTFYGSHNNPAHFKFYKEIIPYAFVSKVHKHDSDYIVARACYLVVVGNIQ
ncbi:hypothetical protein CHS0354_013860 [Potamilus streckersoni]|uniref:Uncharacterized protein n=1 Tax=Potamilus streckersoni TaxID=2493646 RepID=A0AAE0W6W5_9BIVA|nr:hypothetical protein CHS0354_013860 [Potamilus streckersoni]